jgi:hypothetical protein
MWRTSVIPQVQASFADKMAEMGSRTLTRLTRATPPSAAINAAVFGIALSLVPVPTGMSGDCYLSRSGPPALRFASLAVAPSSYVWPSAPGRRQPNTNAVDKTETGLVPPLTNGHAGFEFTSSTNLSVASIEPVTQASGFIVPSPVVGPNSLSASNLLIMTPQMLAEFFNANLDGSYKTNGLTGIDVPFNPPGPSFPASSEATYRSK